MNHKLPLTVALLALLAGTAATAENAWLTVKNSSGTTVELTVHGWDDDKEETRDKVRERQTLTDGAEHTFKFGFSDCDSEISKHRVVRATPDGEEDWVASARAVISLTPMFGNCRRGYWFRDKSSWRCGQEPDEGNSWRQYRFDSSVSDSERKGTLTLKAQDDDDACSD